MQSVESPDKLPLWAEFTEVPDSPTEIHPRPDFHLNATTTYGYPYREVSSDDTINEDDCFIVINTGNAITLTLAENLSLYKELYFIRPVTSTNAVTIARSGDDTIEGDTSFDIFGAKTATGIDSQKVTLKKSTSTDWSFVAGTVSGSTSNGNYVKYSNETMICWGTKNITTGGSAVTSYRCNASCYRGSATWTYPAEFAAVPVIAYADGYGGVFHNTITRSTCGIGCERNEASTASVNIIAIGRWK